MTDIVVRSPLHGIQRETSTRHISPRVDAHTAKHGLNATEYNKVASPRLTVNPSVHVRSPRPRENVVFVGHSATDNDTRVSPREGQTPVEIATSSEHNVHGYRRDRVPVENVEPRTQRDEALPLAVHVNLEREHERNNHMVSDVDETRRHPVREPLGDVRLSVGDESRRHFQLDSYGRNVIRENEQIDSRRRISSDLPNYARHDNRHDDSQQLYDREGHAQEFNNLRVGDNFDTRRQDVASSLESTGHPNRHQGINNTSGHSHELVDAGSGSRRHEEQVSLDATRHTNRHDNRRIARDHSREINSLQAENNTDHRRRESSRSTGSQEERRPSQVHTQASISQDRNRARRLSSIGSRSVSSGRTRARSARTTSTEASEKDEKYVVPALPMPLAITCCVLNFIIPGLGSMLGSLGVLCCAKTGDMTFKEKCGSCCTVFGIGVLQLLLVACFLIGWVWSCIWGITFIGMSVNYYNVEEEEEGDANMPAWERNLRGRTPLPVPQIVSTQPYPGIGYDDLRREHERRRRLRQERQRRPRSRLSQITSNFIYPMRAPSNMAYHSPPPPYEESTTDAPSYQSLDAMASSREETRRSVNTGNDDRSRTTQLQTNEQFRPRDGTIQEEDLT